MRDGSPNILLVMPDQMRGDCLSLEGHPVVRTHEHATCYDAGQAYHFLTDGRMKYIWRPADGREQLFDLATDPQELHDLAPHPDRANDLQGWREHLVEALNGRAEGFTDGVHLIPGCCYDAVLPHAEKARGV